MVWWVGGTWQEGNGRRRDVIGAVEGVGGVLKEAFVWRDAEGEEEVFGCGHRCLPIA